MLNLIKRCREAIVQLFVIVCAFSAITLLPASAQAAGTALEVGVLPNVSARVLMDQYLPMQGYLSRRLGQSVQVSTAPDWREFYQRARRGDYDVVIAAANVARLMEKDLGFRAVLVYGPKIPALLIAARRSEGADPQRLLQGNAVAMANPASLVVFEGLNWLARHNLEVDRDFRTLIVRRDDSVGSAVLRGEAAVGMLSMGEYLGHPEAVREQLRVVSTMAEVASFIVCVNPSLAAPQVLELRSALLEFGQGTDEGKQFFNRTGFKTIMPVNEKDMVVLDSFVDKTRNALD